MKKTYSLLFILFLLSSCTSQKWIPNIQPVDGQDTLPVESLRSLFKKGDAGYACFRIPAIVVAKDGSVLAFCEARKNGCSDTGNIDLVMRKSTDNGHTWGPMQVVWDDGENVCGNPAPVVDRKTGDIHLLLTWNKGEDHESEIIAQTSEDTRRIFHLASSDHGNSWTTPKEITEDVKLPNWTWYATGPVHGIQLENKANKGRLIIPCDHIEAETKKYYSHIIYSDDHGQSWKLGGATPQDQVNECTVVELPNGELLLNMRNYARKESQTRQVALSKDGGITWQYQRFDLQLPEPRCQAAMLRVDKKGKNLLLFTNPADGKSRKNMTLSISEDNGQTWPQKIPIFKAHAAYSDLAEMDNGKIILFYEAGHEGAYDGIHYTIVSLK